MTDSQGLDRLHFLTKEKVKRQRTKYSRVVQEVFGLDMVIKIELCNLVHILLFLCIVTKQSYTFSPPLFDLQKSLRVKGSE